MLNVYSYFKVKLNELCIKEDNRPYTAIERHMLEELENLYKKDKATFVKCNKWNGMRYTKCFCPNCNKPAEMKISHIRPSDVVYCRHCGQKLKYPKLTNYNNKPELDWSTDDTTSRD